MNMLLNQKMNKKIRIVQILPSLAVGGAENFVASLCASFDFSRCDITIISFKNEISDFNKELLNKTPVKIIYLNKKKGFSFSFIRHFEKALFSEHADIINCHLHSIFYVNLFIKKLNSPVFYTVHSIDNAELRKEYQKLIRKNVQKSFIKLVGISKLVSDSICQLYDVKNCITIYNGIILPTNVSMNNEKHYDFINVGRFVEVKNQSLLLKAFEMVNNKYPNTNLLLVGQGDLYSKLLEETKGLKAKSHITLINNCDNPREYYLDSKIFVLSSIYEGNPISILEALSYRLPVVSTSVGGVPDIITNGKNGLLSIPNDANSLSSCMEKLLIDNELYSKMSKNNLLLIKDYDIKQTAKLYLEQFVLALSNGDKK